MDTARLYVATRGALSYKTVNRMTVPGKRQTGRGGCEMTD